MQTFLLNTAMVGCLRAQRASITAQAGGRSRVVSALGMRDESAREGRRGPYSIGGFGQPIKCAMRPFKKIEELMNVRGIGEKNFLKLKPQITVGAAKADHEQARQP